VIKIFANCEEAKGAVIVEAFPIGKSLNLPLDNFLNTK
jgi:hypothetical protein